MHMGQPALLYLVPTCLGTMCYIGWRRKELQQLWDGPRVLRAADDVVFGNSGSNAGGTAQHAPLPLEEQEEPDKDDAVALAVPPSAVDDDDDAPEGDLSLTANGSRTNPTSP